MSRRRLSNAVAVAAAVLLLHQPIRAQDDAALRHVAEGWGRGDWVLLAHVMLNPETGGWEDVEDSPWSRWTVRQVGPRSVEYMTATGAPTVVEFSDGLYLDRSLSEASIVEHGIFGPENWRILVLFPSPPGAPQGVRYYAELAVAGDVFVWTNWLEDADEVRRRVMYSASKLVGG